MDLKQILKDVKVMSEMAGRNSIHAEKLYQDNKKELDEFMPNLVDDLKKMVESKDIEGLKNKLKQVNDKTKENARKRTNKG